MPLIFGGGQEQGLFPGTEGLANIVGIGKAAQLCTEDLKATAEKLRQFQQVFMDQLKQIPEVRITGPADLDRRLPGHVSFAVSGAEGEALVMQAALRDICISSGSACHQGMIEPSHVLKAIGQPEKEARGSIRISCSRFNSLEECKNAATQLASILSKATQKSAALT
jgi:cysteine desulfurase